MLNFKIVLKKSTIQEADNPFPLCMERIFFLKNGVIEARIVVCKELMHLYCFTNKNISILVHILVEKV